MRLAIYLLFALFPAVIYAFLLFSKSPRYGLIVSVISCVIFANLYIDTDTKFDKRKNLFEANPLYAKVSALSDTGRVFPMSGRGPRIWSAYGINDIRDISVVHTKRYHQYFKQFVEGKNRCWHKFVLCSKLPESISLDALRWLGVDLLIISKRQFPKLAQNPDKNWEVIANYEGYQFIRLHDVVPLVSFTDDITQVDSLTQLSQLHEWGNVNESPALTGSSHLKPTLEKNSVKILTEDYQMDKGGKIEVKTESPGYLLIKNQFYPGWKAWVSTEQVPILRSNYLFQAIQIPKGRSTIKIEYLPNSIKIGALISLTGIGILLGINIMLSRGRRKYRSL